MRIEIHSANETSWGGVYAGNAANDLGLEHGGPWGSISSSILTGWIQRESA